MVRWIRALHLLHLLTKTIEFQVQGSIHVHKAFVWSVLFTNLMSHPRKRLELPSTTFTIRRFFFHMCFRHASTDALYLLPLFSCRMVSKTRSKLTIIQTDQTTKRKKKELDKKTSNAARTKDGYVCQRVGAKQSSCILSNSIGFWLMCPLYHSSWFLTFKNLDMCKWKKLQPYKHTVQ